MHRLADRIFDQAKLLGGIGYNFARNRVIPGNLLQLYQGSECGQPSAASDNLIDIGRVLGLALPLETLLVTVKFCNRP
jgi:hypothetical protein